MVMMQDEKWMIRYKEVVSFIETNHRNSSKHNDEERGKFLNWLKANRKAMNPPKGVTAKVKKHFNA
jgi:hypothetical protein